MQSNAVPRWLVEARKSLGQAAIPGPGCNPHIVAMFAMCGHDSVTSDDTPYCAAAIGAWFMKSGLSGTGSLLASSYLNFGVPLDELRVGAIAVLQTASGGWHVGLIEDWTDSTIDLLGGNQGVSRGVHEVNVSRFKRSSVKAVRWPIAIKTAEDIESEGSRQAAKGKMDTAAGWVTTIASVGAGAQAVVSTGDATIGLMAKIVGNPWPWITLILGVYAIASGHLGRLWRTEDTNLGYQSGAKPR